MVAEFPTSLHEPRPAAFPAVDCEVPAYEGSVDENCDCRGGDFAVHMPVPGASGARPSLSSAISLRRNFWTLPLEVIG